MSRSIAWLIPSLLATGLPAQAEELGEKINHALDSARPALMAHLEQSCKSHVRPGALALVLLAAIHDGVESSDPVFLRAVERLSDARCAQTYDLALRLMVMELLPAFPDRDKLARKDVAGLLDHRDEGAFGYMDGTGQWDLSNTQYAALGLRAAKAMGVPIRRSVWSKLASVIGDNQDVTGAFGYQKINSGFPGYASMTAAGIAVLAVCRQALDDKNVGTAALDRKIELGWRWFEQNVDLIGGRDEHWSYYFHYGLERAAILCDVELIGGKSWYALGAQMLVEEQLPGGGWPGTTGGEQENRLSRRGASTATAFAVLFLRRKFQKVAGPITPSIVTLPAIGPNSKDRDVRACAAELRRRGKEALPDVLRALRSEIENQRSAAAIALVGITGQDFGFDPTRDAEANREVIKKAELWYLRNR